MKINQNLKATALAVMLSLGSFTVQAGGIPVIDGAQIGNQVQTWVIEAERWSKEIQQYKQDFENQVNQLKTQKDQLASITGIRDIQGFLTNFSNELKNVTDLDKWLGNSDQILKYGKDILGDNLKSVFESYGVDSLCNNIVASQQKRCEGEIVIETIKQVQNERNSKKVQERIKTIEKIAGQMKTAKDQKEAQDLSNAMQTQIALLNTDKIAMDIAKSREEFAKTQSEKQREDYLKQKREQHTLTIK